MNEQDLANISHELDEKTIDHLETLASIRLGLARQQLEDSEKTLKQLLDRGLVEADDYDDMLSELQEELKRKISRLEDRNAVQFADGELHFEDLDLYIDLLTDS